MLMHTRDTVIVELGCQRNTNKLEQVVCRIASRFGVPVSLQGRPARWCGLSNADPAANRLLAGVVNFGDVQQTL